MSKPTFRASGNSANIDYYKSYYPKNFKNCQSPNSENKFSHGIDYLTFSLSASQTENISDFLLGGVFTNDENTNEMLTRLNTDEIFQVSTTRTSNGYAYIFSIVYESVPVSLFQFIQYGEVYQDQFNISSGLKFYGGFYRMKLIGGVIPKSLLAYFKMFTDDCLISRIDYRFDFLIKKKIFVPDIDEIMPNRRKDKKYKDYRTGSELESWDCGRKSNKTCFIRLYNKNIELVKKLKGIYLYGDILKEDFKTFHRLEYEFGQKYTAGFMGKDIDELLDKCFKTIGILPSEYDGYMYKPSRVSDLTNELDRNRYIKVFNSMVKNLKLNGIDPAILYNDRKGIEYSNSDIIINIEKEMKLLGLTDEIKKFIEELKKILHTKHTKKCLNI